MTQFTKKWILITGASSGIGEAFAQRFAAEGANLVLVARNESALQNLATTLKEKHNIEAIVIPKDLSHIESSQELFNAVQEKNIAIDVLVNNAGFGTHGKLDQTNLTSNQAMLMLNIVAVSSLTQLFLRDMLAKKSGVVITISSILGLMPTPYLANYAASKAFALSFTEALWGEYNKEGIQFLAVCPASTQSNFHQVAQMKASTNIASAEQVVEQSLKALRKNKIYVITGSITNYFLGQLSRIFSHKRLVLMIEENMKRSGKKSK